MLNFIHSIPLSYYIIATGINFLTSTVLGVFIYSRNKNANVNKIFAFFCLTVAQWSFFYLLWLNVKEKGIAEFYLRTCMIGVAFMPTVFTHFILYLVKEKINPRLLRLNYIASLIVVGTIYTPLYAHNFEPFLVFPYWGKAGVFFPFHLLHFFANVLYSHYRMFKCIKQSESIVFKKQIGFVFVGTIIGYLGGIANYLCWYRFPLPPVPNILVSVYVATVAYAIVRHHLMDIEVIIKKTIVFAGLSSFVLGVIIVVSFVLQAILDKFGLPVLLTQIASAFLIIGLYEPVKNFLLNATNKYLFQKKYNPTELIKTFTKEVITLMDLNLLVNKTIITLAKILNLENCSILLLDKDESKYEIQGAYGLIDERKEINVNSYAVKYLKGNNDVIVANKGMRPEIKSEIEGLRAELVIPLMHQTQLIGILMLGKKKSDQEYTKEDIDILISLAQAEAIALSNAKFFTEAKQNAKLAAIGVVAAGINHEVCNPINRIMTSMQIFLKSKEMRMFEDKSPSEIELMSDKLMKEAMDDMRKVVSITRKLSDFAKPSKESHIEKIKIIDILKDSISLLRNDMEMNKIVFEGDVKDELEIMADADQIQEIFFNIIRNAIQAIGQDGTVKVSAKKQDGRIMIDVLDTGPGIEKDRVQKIFNPFYTTKEAGKGTGLGLAIVKQLVAKNKGAISVKSEVGKGTTFKLEFPEIK